MNRTLRRRHWRWMLLLAIVLPLLLMAFLGSRDFSSHDMPLPEGIKNERSQPGEPVP